MWRTRLAHVRELKPVTVFEQTDTDHMTTEASGFHVMATSSGDSVESEVLMALERCEVTGTGETMVGNLNSGVPINW